MAQTSEHRQLLRYCQTTSPDGSSSERYVDDQVFQLWCDKVSNTHGLEVTELGTCLWIPEKEYLRQQQLFDRNHDIAPITRVEIDQLDTKTNINHQRVRFIPTRDLQMVLQRFAVHFQQTQGEARTVLLHGRALHPTDHPKQRTA